MLPFKSTSFVTSRIESPGLIGLSVFVKQLCDVRGYYPGAVINDTLSLFMLFQRYYFLE